MRKLRLYIAASLDGYIASENGGLEWLYEVPNPRISIMGTMISSNLLVRLSWG